MIQVGLTAYGMSGKVFHGPLLEASDKLNLCAVVERTKNESEKFHPKAKIYRSLEELLYDSDINWVVINTPHFMHFEQAFAALQAGKNVVIEKPMCLTVKQAEILIAKAKDLNKALTVFQNRRWDSDFLTVEKLVESGKLGTVTLFESRYDRFRNYIEPNTWKEIDGEGSGLLYNLGSHLIDQALKLFGKPETVFSKIRKERIGSQVPDSYLLILSYANLEVRLSSSYHIKEEMPRFAVHGSEGSFVKFGLDVQEEALKKREKILNASWGLEPENLWGILNLADGSREKWPSERGDYLAFYNELADYCKGGKSLPVSADEALNVIKVIELAYLSNQEGRVIPFE